MITKDTTIISVCANRWEFLSQCLPTWIEYTESPIIVVDYCSVEPIQIDDDRVRVARIDGHSHFNKSHALNIALNLVETPKVAMLDADTNMNSNQFSSMAEVLPPKTYIAYAGYGFSAYGNGLFYLSDALAINGYQEFMPLYFEDIDFYERLELYGVKRFVNWTIPRLPESIDLNMPDSERMQWCKIKSRHLASLVNAFYGRSYIKHRGMVGNYGKPVGAEKPVEFSEFCYLSGMNTEKVFSSFSNKIEINHKGCDIYCFCEMEKWTSPAKSYIESIHRKIQEC